MLPISEVEGSKLSIICPKGHRIEQLTSKPYLEIDFERKELIFTCDACHGKWTLDFHYDIESSQFSFEPDEEEI